MRKIVLAGLAAACLMATGQAFMGQVFMGQALAQEFPTHTLTMVNPFAAGGPNDVPGRLFAQRMGEVLGQTVIVENVGGAGGMTGADRVAKAQPDGYTFLQGTVGTQAQNQTLYKKPAYDSVRDFVSVGLLLEAPLVLVHIAAILNGADDWHIGTWSPDALFLQLFNQAGLSETRRRLREMLLRLELVQIQRLAGLQARQIAFTFFARPDGVKARELQMRAGGAENVLPGYNIHPYSIEDRCRHKARHKAPPDQIVELELI